LVLKDISKTLEGSKQDKVDKKIDISTSILRHSYNYHKMGANGTTRATLACFLIVFVIAFGKIFLEYYWNILEKVLEILFFLN
jgi:hypothetical protein